MLENFGHTVEEALPELTLDKVVLVTPGDLMGSRGGRQSRLAAREKGGAAASICRAAIAFKTVLAEGAKAPPKPVDVTLEDIAFLQYTGGTTGVAKGAIAASTATSPRTSRRCEAWMRPFFGERTDHVMVTALPLYHIFALTVCALLMTRLGACQLLIANPRDIPGFVKT